ncbi:MAG: adenosylmethionine--8-amino-7-oxononanoate transaminase [Chitinophagaceae bacterium]|nr:adenosylmethionine--8-amino-7-oxononanoate transaminase [Chitinophagaceae bacterium]
MENSLAERDKLVVWHPYTPQKYAPDPIPVIKGEGVYLVDANGNSYIDAISSWWVNLHGHAHPYIADKIYEQAKTLEQVIFAGFTHEPAVQLAERLLRILPGNFSKVFYSDNGSTAVEVAIKMAIQYWWNMGAEYKLQDSGYGMLDGKRRNKILALKNSYHGDTFGAMSVSDRGIFTLAFQDKLFEVIFIDPTNLHDIILNFSKGVTHYMPAGQEGSSPACRTGRLTIHPDEIACFIYEPLLQGAGGMKMIEAGPLNQLLNTLQEYGIICIADEVMTGFGRTGRLFASAYLPCQPDIICLSKGLTGGYMALGVTACSKKIHDAFVSDDRLKTFFHGHSYTANPLACTAGLASLDLLQQQDCLENIERINQQHQQFLIQLQTTNHKLQTKHYRCLGTILAFEIQTEGKDDYLNNISAAITQKALAKGVFIRPLGNTVYIMPPYCITKTQLQKVYDVIIEILNEI